MTAALLAGWRGAGGHNSRGALDISTQAEICPLDFRGEFRDNYLEMMSYHLARTNLAPNSWVRRAYRYAGLVHFFFIHTYPICLRPYKLCWGDRRIAAASPHRQYRTAYPWYD